MQILSFAPTGPWPELGTCPCCGQPWPPIGTDPFLPLGLDFPEPFHYDPEPSPYVVEAAPEPEPEPEVFKLAVSEVSLEFLLFLESTR